MLFRLVILNGPLSGQRVTVPDSVMTIGRADDCDLTLDDAEAASRHLQIRMERGALHLLDLGSMSGTLVNQIETRRCLLKHGDVLEIGRTRLLVEAHVQAEVPAGWPGVDRPRRRTLQRAGAVAAVLFLLTGFWLVRSRPVSRPPNLTPAAPEPSPSSFRQDTDWADRSAESVAEQMPAVQVPSYPVAQADPVDDGIGDELRLLRGDLEQIRDVLSSLADARRDSDPLPFSSPDPQADAARALLGRAEAAMEEGRFMEAERLLEGLHALLPDFMPGWEARARLYEHRGHLARAIEKWEHIVDSHAIDEAGRERAWQEKNRLARLQRDLEAETASVLIATLQQRKFPERDGIEEMRTITVGLVPEEPFQRPDPDQVSVEVAFYEMEWPDGSVFPSRRVPPVVLHPEGEWGHGEQKSLVATYRVDEIPPREGVPASAPPRLSFVGYRVRLFVRGLLASEVFRPVTLADLPDSVDAAFRAEP